jgi:hypothetical protein
VPATRENRHRQEQKQIGKGFCSPAHLRRSLWNDTPEIHMLHFLYEDDIKIKKYFATV